MKIGFVGLGRMGKNMTLNLLDHKKKVVGYNRSPRVTRSLSRRGMKAAYSLEELVQNLGKGKKIIWLMIPAGKSVDTTIKKLIPLLNAGDIIIDGGNSYYKESQRRYKALKKKRIQFLDIGTSGGIEGARRGACMMIGGDKKTFKVVEPFIKSMCVRNGYGYMGSTGAGHFVKGIHNGIEYGMVGAINEGIEAIRKHTKKFDLDEKEAIKVYAHGSVIESRLTGWLWQAYKTKGFMKKISCKVPKGETEDEMTQLTKEAKMPLLKEAIKMRKKSRAHQFCAQAIAAMRNLWGGHRTFHRTKGNRKRNDETY